MCVSVCKVIYMATALTLKCILSQAECVSLLKRLTGITELLQCAYIIVIVQSLFDHIELPVLSRVIAYARTVQPVSIVAAHIMVNLLNQNQKPINTPMRHIFMTS